MKPFEDLFIPEYKVLVNTEQHSTEQSFFCSEAEK
jgi:hypothetical protein